MSRIQRRTDLAGASSTLRCAVVALFVLCTAALAACGGQSNSPSGSDPASAPSITVQPENQSVTVGATASFSVVASGTAPLSYQWLANGTAIAGATSASYTTGATVSGDNGSTYSVQVSNAVGSATSAAATLTVTTEPVAPTITTQPQNQTVTVGATATFSVVASGTAPLSYQWSKNGAAISGATSASYTTEATVSGDNGSTFSVQVSNTAGNVTSTTATLMVTTAAVAPSITTQPQSQSVLVGGTATFTVVASGTAPLAYQWSKNGAAISGATSASYTTPAAASGDNGASFTVKVTNSAGNATSAAATLTVNAVAVAPSITTQPQNQTVMQGTTATFTVVASGTAPLSYQWSKNGTAISGATSASYTTPATASTDNGATFSVQVSNTAGNATSATATLTVSAAPVAPSITTQPQNQTVTVGATASFSVVASGTAPLSYQWSKNGTVITGATSASYTTPAAASTDNGASFTVKVTNSAGSATSSAATLTVNAAVVAPTITTQPQNENVLVGAAATFTVVASGTAPLSYQWFLAGVAITGATSASYTIPVVTLGNNGSLFTVQVSNSAGTATSNGATLDVTASGGAAVPILFQHIATSTDPVGSGITGSAFVIHTESLPPNTVAVMGVSAPSGHTVSVTDTLAGGWAGAVCAVDAGSGSQKSWLFVQSLGGSGGPDKITVNVGSATQPVQFDVTFYENINTSSPTNGVLCPSSPITPTSGGVISPGSFTPTTNNDANGGNVIWNYTPLGCGGFSNTTVTGWTAGPAFNLLNGGGVLWPVNGYPQASQAFVQTTQASVTPSITAKGENASNGDCFNSLTVALQAANNSAAAPATIHVANIIHESIYNSSDPTIPSPFPTTGNLRVVATTWPDGQPTGGGATLSSITSSDGCAWTLVGNGAAGDAVQGYAQNCAPCPTCTVSLHFSGSGNLGGSFRLYDVTNANSSSFQNEVSGNAGCGTTLSSAPTITPAVSAGLTIASVGIGTGPGLSVSSPSGATFDLWTFSGQTDTDDADNADLQGHYYFSTNATQNWTWSLNAPSSCYWVAAIYE
jgi:hypothetical protein